MRGIKRSGRWIVLATGALALGGCGQADRDFTTVIHRDPGTVAAELGNIDTSEASQLIPQTQVVRSQPGENQLLYTVPSADAAVSSTILFELSPLGGDAGTRVSVHLHVPRLAVQDGKELKELSAARVEKALQDAVSKLGTELDHHESGDSARKDLSMLLVAIAITSHPDLFARLTRDAEGMSADALRRLWEGAGTFGDPSMSGRGVDPNPREQGGVGSPGNNQGSSTPGGIDARPMDDARGVDPNPR